MSIRTKPRYDKDIGIIRPGFKTAMMNMLRAPMDKVDSMQEQMNNARMRWKF